MTTPHSYGRAHLIWLRLLHGLAAWIFRTYGMHRCACKKQVPVKWAGGRLVLCKHCDGLIQLPDGMAWDDVLPRQA